MQARLKNKNNNDNDKSSNYGLSIAFPISTYVNLQKKKMKLVIKNKLT